VLILIFFRIEVAVKKNPFRFHGRDFIFNRVC
jgi:hypothetical protein